MTKTIKVKCQKCGYVHKAKMDSLYYTHKGKLQELNLDNINMIEIEMWNCCI